MTGRRWLRSLGLVALLPLFGLLFSLSAVVASSIPNVLVMAVNVHGLSLPLARDAGPPHAPLSLQVLTAAQLAQYTGAVSVLNSPLATPPVAHNPASGPRPLPPP